MQSIIKAFYVIAIAMTKAVTKFSIIVTNPKLWQSYQTCQISVIGNIKCTRWGSKRRKKKKGNYIIINEA